MLPIPKLRWIAEEWMLSLLASRLGRIQVQLLLRGTFFRRSVSLLWWAWKSLRNVKGVRYGVASIMRISLKCVCVRAFTIQLWQWLKVTAHTFSLLESYLYQINPLYLRKYRYSVISQVMYTANLPDHTFYLLLATIDVESCHGNVQHWVSF